MPYEIKDLKDYKFKKGDRVKINGELFKGFGTINSVFLNPNLIKGEIAYGWEIDAPFPQIMITLDNQRELTMNANDILAGKVKLTKKNVPEYIIQLKSFIEENKQVERNNLTFLIKLFENSKESFIKLTTKEITKTFKVSEKNDLVKEYFIPYWNDLENSINTIGLNRSFFGGLGIYLGTTHKVDDLLNQLKKLKEKGAQFITFDVEDYSNCLNSSSFCFRAETKEEKEKRFKTLKRGKTEKEKKELELLAKLKEKYGN